VSAWSEKRVAIVGLGVAGTAHREALVDFPELRLCAVVEPEPESLRAALDEGLRGFANTATMLGAGLVPDLALICTPPGTRSRMLLSLLRAGVDCLIEPPLASTLTDANRIETVSERLNRAALSVARFRASAILERARQLITQGRIGRLCYVECSLSVKRNALDGWRGDPCASGGGVWMDLGPDALDLAESLAGRIERLRMVHEQREQRAAVEDEVTVETEHTAGVGARIHLTWNRSLTAPLARCVGTEGELWVGDAQTVIRQPGREQVIAGGLDERSLLRAVLDAFLRQRVKSGPAMDAGAQSVAWLEAGYRSLGSRSWEIA
jgi:predicted dehydrogenase